MNVTIICGKHQKPIAECGCPTITAMLNTTHVWPETKLISLNMTDSISATPVYRADQHTLDAIRAIVREEVAKALAEQEDEIPHIVTVQQDFEAGVSCEYTDYNGKRFRGVMYPVEN